MLTTYAQNFEDVILWRALKGVDKGFYIDIGAQDPVVDSVSLAFYKAGWRGVHVEPAPGHAELLRNARPNEEVIQAAVTNAQTITLYDIPGTGLSTGVAEVAESHRAAGFAPVQTTVDTLSLGALLDRYKVSEIHWLKIDVEGMEADVISSWGDSDVRPWIVVVESTIPNSPEPAFSAWDPEMLARGYRFVYFDGLNRFYLHERHQDRIGAFGPGPNYFDQFALSEHTTSYFAAGLVQEISGLRKNVSDLQNALAERQETLASNLARAEQFAWIAEAWKAQFQSAQNEIAQIKSSPSWRFTAPLRSINAMLRRIVRADQNG